MSIYLCILIILALLGAAFVVIRWVERAMGHDSPVETDDDEVEPYHRVNVYVPSVPKPDLPDTLNYTEKVAHETYRGHMF